MKLHLLPRPASVRPAPGGLLLRPECGIFLDQKAGTPLSWAASALRDALRTAGRRAPGAAPRQRGRPRPAGIVLALKSTGPGEAYRLAVGAERLLVEGEGQPGLFYGIQTVIQLLRDHGARLPRMTIRDAPAFPQRGFYLDVSRGRVPTLARLKRLADTLAALKINQLQLYVEHVFDFRFDPRIGQGSCPLTREDLRELDAHCRERFVDLVPSLACFGHMGRVLSIPSYRNLAEVEWQAGDWHKSPWTDRLRGATINPRDPRAKELLSRMIDEFLPCFSSGLFNACCDETYDLGRGRNAALARRIGIARLYLDHIRFLRARAEKHGKRLMFWGDVMLQHPQSIPEIPADCIMLDWGYSPDTDFAKAERFTHAGLETYVCPATRGYRVVFNAVGEARANIARYARAGFLAHASGVLTTDWGDMGHFNMPATSLHGMALGAAMAWNPSADAGRAFDAAFALQVFGDRTGEISRFYRRMGRTPARSWPLMLHGLDGDAAGLPTRPQAANAREVARGELARLGSIRPACHVAAHDLQELALACEAVLLNADKAALARDLAGRRGHLSSPLRKRCLRLADHLNDYVRRYARTWLETHRPSQLEEVRRALVSVAEQARRLSRQGGEK